MVEDIVATPQAEQAYTARQLNPANPDLARSASVPAVLGYRAYVAALAKVIYYWGYPFKANWLPAPDGGFALCLRTYVPTEALLNGSYKLPNVVRAL